MRVSYHATVRKRRQRLMALGKCIDCEDDNPTGSARCEACRVIRKQWRANTQRRRLRQTLDLRSPVKRCTGCGAEVRGFCCALCEERV